MPVVLIAEDEPPITEVLTYNLKKAGFETLSVEDGAQALELIIEHQPDVLILDWMMPGLSGIEICQRVRDIPNVAQLPIMMLTARGDETDRITGFEAGADDYMTKPFSPRELVARIRALLRRANPNQAEKNLKFGDIVLNPEQHKVTANGAPVKLGPTEYRLLKYFMESPGRVHSRETLLDRVWSSEVYVESRTVDVHVRRLRKSLLGVGGDAPIRTVRGVGYSLDFDVD